MGYVHYFRRKRNLDRANFDTLVQDAKIIIEAVKEYSVLLAGPDGSGEPVVDSKQIALNGREKCGHPVNKNIIIPWPADNAGGVAKPGEDAISGQWFGGSLLSSRACNGDCSYESFILPRILKPESWQEPDENGFYGDSVKTAYRPYDLAVTAILIAAKHHLREQIQVFSDGTDQQWWDAKLLCYSRLGYGSEYTFTTDQGLVKGYFRDSDAIADATLAQRDADANESQSG